MLNALMWPFTDIKFHQLSVEEVLKHNTVESLWIVSNNSVYDVTDMLSSHPGGQIAMIERGGGKKNCEKDFSFHSEYAKNLWKSHKIGEISEEGKNILFGYDSFSNKDKEEEEEEDCKLLSSEEDLSVENVFLSSPDWIVYNRWCYEGECSRVTTVSSS